MLSLDMGRALTQRFVEKLDPLCDHIEVAGSIRRQRPEVNDIDIVISPSKSYRSPDSLLPGSIVHPSQVWKVHIPAVLRQAHLTKVQSGDELHRFRYVNPQHAGFQVDLYRARPETWGIILLVRTGSVAHNIRLCTIAKRQGLELSAARGVVKDGKVIASWTEEEIFAALGLPFVEPKDREVI